MSFGSGGLGVCQQAGESSDPVLSDGDVPQCGFLRQSVAAPGLRYLGDFPAGGGLLPLA